MVNQKEPNLSAILLDSTDMKDEQMSVKPSETKRRGPPNRMNDLSYSDWMKFQKSFFWHTSHLDLVQESIEFFSKEVWSDGSYSRILLLGFPIDVEKLELGRRHIESHSPTSFIELLQQLEKLRERDQQFDFIFVNLSPLLHAPTDITTFLDLWAERYFALLHSLVRSQQYCGMVVDLPEAGGSGFPLPWSVGLAGREHLRLRDEKIGLIESEKKVYYCLFMQNTNDSRPAARLDTASLQVSHRARWIVPWMMPKSPPRKQNEIRHPAKFPESLIEQFIQDFTHPDDNVLDPMVGTGSAVIAAVKLGRNGFGVDLNRDFIDVSLNRLTYTLPVSLFEEFQPSATGTFVYGDATHLSELPELQSVRFTYCVTSPPYWSMLSNPGSENQRARRQKNLPLVYSNNTHDLGNINDYDEFLKILGTVYDQVASKLYPGGYLTVVVKNVKRNHILYPLAWDLAARLCGPDGKYDYAGTTLWCQDDIGLKPFAVGIYWVSNILHHYCLHFRRRDNL